jgi:hypothetical protein
MRRENPNEQNIHQLQVKFMLQTIADMFLDGNYNAPEIIDYFTYKRSFK